MPATVIGYAGESVQLTAHALDPQGGALGPRTAAWVSASPAVATVNDAGLLILHAPGVTIVTASCLGEQVRLTVTVLQVPVSGMVVAPPSMNLRVGESGRFVATTLDSAGGVLPGRSVTWRSTDSRIASVDPASGLVHALRAGAASAIASGEGVQALGAITVSSIPECDPVAAPFVQSGETVAGTLDAGDCPFLWTAEGRSTASFHDLYRARGSGSQALEIRVQSNAFEPLLRLLDGSLRRICTETATDSRVVCPLGPGIEYYIVVSSGGPWQAGPYELSLRGIPLPEDPPPAGGWPNQPAGATIGIDEAFSTLELGPQPSGAWVHSDAWWNGDVRIVGAGPAGSSALRWTWAPGTRGGDSPGRAVNASPTLDFSRYYIGVVVQWSRPWTNHPSGVNKILYWGERAAWAAGHATSQFYLNRRDHLIDLTLQWGQNYPGQPGGPDTQRNIPSQAAGERRIAATPVDDGSWHLVEIVADASTGGQPNGRVRVWVDGTLQFDIADVRWAPAGDARFYGVDLDPVWGGVDGIKPYLEWIQLDHLRIAGH